MSFSGVNLGGAKNRLLPASIPFSFFAAAAFFQVFAWLMLLAGAFELTDFSGGKGLILTAIHLLTIGVLAMTAIGASFQLLPVATRQPLVRVWPARLCLWLMIPGTILLTFGMSGANETALSIGAIGVVAGLLVYAVLTADNLRRAGKMPVIAAHGWAALIALIGLVVIGALLIVDFDSGFLPDHQKLATTHMILAVFGFMGLLVLGFSQILIPMFALAPAPRPRPGWYQLGLAGLALLLGVTGIMLAENAITIAAGLLSLVAAALYLWQMQTALKKRMRKRLGSAFILIRVSWLAMFLGLVSGLAIVIGVPVTNGITLFAFLVLVGWLLTFLTGVLQRIVPFLASMHASTRKGKPPLLSDLTPALPLKLHAIFHLAALLLIPAGIVAELPIVVTAGAALGLAGAIAFAAFIIFVIIRLNAPGTTG